MKHLLQESKVVCIECAWSTFPDPKGQCYKTGGLICTRLSLNVGKFDSCLLESPEGKKKLKRLGRGRLASLRLKRDGRKPAG
jgi:hypothetical protein